MALDEPKENDKIIKENRITYLINKELYEKAQPISVDFIETAMVSGFSFSSALKTGGGCGTTCSTC
jgi:Fe-S cluster assembly iron-binding protein IscA